MTRLSDLRWAPILISLAISVTAAPVAGQDAKAILVLHSYGHDFPTIGPFNVAFARTVREATDDPVGLYVETLDPNRFGGEPQARLMRAYLRERYADKNIVAIAAVYDSALAFVIDEREPLFPGVPVAALVTRSAYSLPERVAVITSGNAIGQSAALALKLNPGAARIAVIDGAPPNAGRKAVSAEVQNQIQAQGLNLPVRFLFDLPLDELVVQVRALPPDTIIVMVNQTLGPRGKTIDQTSAITEVAKAARAPLYVIGDGMVGYGSLGGMVLRMEEMAKEQATLALRIAKDGARRISSTESSLVPMFDWRELRRWGISEARLPAGSIVQFRQLSAWDQYKVYIMGALAIVALQSAMIAGLVVQRARRRRVEEQNDQLVGRLIDAQEAERSRIGRDLHDDVCQRLAVLAMMLSGLKQRLTGSTPQPDVDEVMTTLQERTFTLATDVRNLSHDLHPSVLQHAGLVPVLKAHCDEFARQQKIDVAFSADEGVGSVDGAAALCVYRVTQEALTNTGRHANASAVRVRLTRTAQAIELEIVDNGIGFKYGRPTPSGLGLRSIDERVRFNKGTARVESRPGKGTSVFVRVPLIPAATGAASTTPLF